VKDNFKDNFKEAQYIVSLVDCLNLFDLIYIIEIY
jgi:hypothetical protein